MPDYQKGKIYKLWSPSKNLVYYGSTTETISRRLSKHLLDFKKNVIYVSSFKILECEDYKIELVEEYPCNNRQQLCKKEGEYIRTNECVNIQIAGRTKQEWHEENPDKVKESQKKYCEENPDKVKESKKKYCEENTNKVKDSKKKYYEENVDKVKESQKKHYQINIEKHKKYRQDNAEKRVDYDKIYRDANADKIKEYKRQYYLKQKALKTKKIENV